MSNDMGTGGDSGRLSCPRCGCALEISALMRQQLEGEIQTRLRAQFDAASQEMQAKLAEAARAEAGVLKRQRELEEREQQLVVEQERRINEQVAHIREQEQQRAAAQAAAAAVERAADVAVQEAALAAMQAKLAEAARVEAGVLKRQRELEEKEQQLGVAAEHKIQAEVARIREQEQQRAAAQAAAAAVERAAEVAARSAEFKRAQEAAAAEAAAQVAVKEAALAAMQAKLADAARVEAGALKRQRELEEREQQLVVEQERRISEQVAHIRAQEQQRAAEQAATATATAVAAKEAQLVELQERLTVAAQGQVAVLRRERELEEREQQLEIAHEQKLTEEGRRVRELAEKQLQERLQAQKAQQQLESEEQRLRMETLQRKLDDMQRSVAQGSQQTQGEAQEVVLRDALGMAFPLDVLEDVAKGIHGADVVQRVRAADGSEAQTILWESKRTKSWSHGWIAKLREDQGETRAAVAVIVTQVMPPGVAHFGLVEGVWVCAWAYAVPLAAALRSGMIELAQVRRASEGRGEKMEMLYAYLTGPEFKVRVTGLVEAFSDLEDDLRSERNAMMARWKRREKQLHRARANLGAFYGDLTGIAGSKLPAIEILELGHAPPALEAGDDDDEADDDADPDALAAVLPEDPQLIELLHDLLPAAGAGIGNGTLSERFLDLARTQHGLALQAGDYERCKRLLIASGRARRGKGRGGSVARIAPDVTS